MILVRLMGGLGNQMFQYAFGMYLAEKNKTILKIDTTLLFLEHSLPNEEVTHRYLELEIFNVHLEFATDAEIIRFNGKKYNTIIGKTYNKLIWQFRKKNLVQEKGKQFHPQLLNLGDNKCLVGGWQCEKYFIGIEPIIRKEYTFKPSLNEKAKTLSKEIKENESLCIHVRRGDNVTSPIYSKTMGTPPLNFYLNGYRLMKSKHPINKVLVFSDDIPWCEENLSEFKDAIIINADYGSDANHLQLMSQCKHFIISNSTFGWWAAWLSDNPGKTVITPKLWRLDQATYPSDIIPEKWLKI